ncbi:MAG: HNH endonuclease [Selenomonadaceae bacterium]|nr:HNH endonuclease [Selenomonadaceae bacterium]
MEIWKPFAEGYEVSNFGNIKSVKHKVPHVLKMWRFARSNYLQVILFNKGERTLRLVHRIVAETFIPNPENKPEVNHINGIKTDNRVENLEWVTHEENIRHAYDTGLINLPSGEKHHKAKLTNEQVAWARSVYIPRDKEFSAHALAKILGVNEDVVQKAVRGQSYKDATGTIHDKFERRLPENVRREIYRLHNPNESEYCTQALASKFNVSISTVQRIVYKQK